MSAVFNRPQDSQPQDAPSVNWLNPLTGGLTTLISGKSPSINLAGQTLLSGALESSTKLSGTAVTGSTTSGFISSTAVISGDRTVAFLCRPATSTPGTKVMFTSTTGAGVAYWVGTENSTNNWSIGGLVDAPSNTVTANTDQFIVATKSGTTHSIYINGVLAGSGTNSMADGASGSTWLRFGTGTGNTWTAAVGVLYLGACWNSRALSAAEVRQLSDKPWQLFEPQLLFITASAAGGASTQNLTPSLFTGAESFYSATVSAGAVTLAPSLFSNSGAFYSATVSSGATLLPALFVSSASFYSPAVTTGEVALTPSLFSNAGAFYAAAVTQDAQELFPALFASAEAFYVPAVTTGAVTLTPSLFSASSTFYSATVSDGSTSSFVRYFDVVTGQLLVLRQL